jgi:hypothetical protein
VKGARQNRHTSTAAKFLFVCESFPLSRSEQHEAKRVARNVAGKNGLRGNARERLPAAGFLICRKWVSADLFSHFENRTGAKLLVTN